MAFSWSKIAKPIIALAPMAGYTDSPFRQIVKKIEKNIICISELISSTAIHHKNEKTIKMLDFKKSELPLIIQLFGNKPEYFIEAGKHLEQMGISGIDINMGCPAKKVVKSEQGSSLIKDPNLAGEIVHQLSKAVHIPISVKTRIGFAKYEEEVFVNFIKILESAGAKLLTIHARTKKQEFSGEVDFSPVYLAKKILKIPVIGNGDITSLEIARKRLKSPDKKITLDGLMIGRASIGNPWLLAEIYADLHKQTYKPPKTLKAKIPLIKKHLLLNVKQKGEHFGLIEMRKQFGSYIKGFPNSSTFRQQLIQSETVEKTLKILDKIASTK